MKRLSLMILLFSLCKVVTAQSISLELTGGYCAPIASSFIPVSAYEFQSLTYPNYYYTSQTLKSTSYGQGAAVALNFNWFSKKDIGFGLRANLLFSAPATSTVYATYLSGNNATVDISEKPFSFQLLPHMSFKHDFKVVAPILEVGMLVGITHVREDYTAAYTSGDLIQSSVNNHGGVMLGFYSSLGLAFKVSRVVRIMLSVNCSAGSYSPAKWDRTSFTVNGQDQLSYLSPSDLHGVYVRQLDPSASQPVSQPHQDLKYSVPFSNVGFTAGLAITFGKKKNTLPEKSFKENKDGNVVHPF